MTKDLAKMRREGDIGLCNFRSRSYTEMGDDGTKVQLNEDGGDDDDDDDEGRTDVSWRW